MQMQSTRILKWVSSRDEYNFSKLYWKERIRTCAIQWSVSSTFHASCQTPFAKQHFHPISPPPPHPNLSPLPPSVLNACVRMLQARWQRTPLQVLMGEQTWIPSWAVKTPSPGQGCWPAMLSPSLPVLISRVQTPAWQTCVFSSHRCIKWIHDGVY